MQFWKAAWACANLNVQKGHTKIIVELFQGFDVNNIPVKLQHGTHNS